MKPEFALSTFIESLPEELRNVPAVFYAPYGFKVIEINGKKRWTPGTFEDYQQAAGHWLGVNPSTIKPKVGGCGNSSPTSCAGGCPPGAGECGGYAYPPNYYVACMCIA